MARTTLRPGDCAPALATVGPVAPPSGPPFSFTLSRREERIISGMFMDDSELAALLAAQESRAIGNFNSEIADE